MTFHLPPDTHLSLPVHPDIQHPSLACDHPLSPTVHFLPLSYSLHLFKLHSLHPRCSFFVLCNLNPVLSPTNEIYVSIR